MNSVVHKKSITLRGRKAERTHLNSFQLEIYLGPVLLDGSYETIYSPRRNSIEIKCLPGDWFPRISIPFLQLHLLSLAI